MISIMRVPGSGFRVPGFVLCKRRLPGAGPFVGWSEACA